MNLQSRLLNRIANTFGVGIENVRIDGDRIAVGPHSLPLLGVFFKAPESSDDASILLDDYLNDFLVESVTPARVVASDPSHKVICILRLESLNKSIDSGVYELKHADGSRCLVFTGSLSDLKGDPDLTEFPEVILAMCLLNGDNYEDEIPTWAKLLESQGPFVICEDEIPPYPLCECGLVTKQKIASPFEWRNNLPTTINKRKYNVPEEAENAYISALQESTTPDVAFLKLYRVLEVLFAGHFKEEITNSDLCSVLSKIQRFQSFSELNILIDLLGRQSIYFKQFTNDDFDMLFKGHKPQGNYQKITNWINQESNICPPCNISALVIYYIRCALVHSKMTDKEPFLIGPFSEQQNKALGHLVEDTRDVVRGMIFEV
jgi:hypothetical protein